MQSAVNAAVLAKVCLAIEQAAQVDPKGISAATRLVDDLELGSFGRLRLAECLEEMFDLAIPDEVFARLVTVADIIRYFSPRYFRDLQSPTRKGVPQCGSVPGLGLSGAAAQRATPQTPFRIGNAPPDVGKCRPTKGRTNAEPIKSRPASTAS